MLAWRAVVLVPVAVALAACGDPSSADGTDGAAVATCRALLAEVADETRLATTVREEEPGFLVRAWTSERPEGQPDHLCRVVRDDDAERGVRVVSLTSQDGSGSYSSRLDLQLDDEG